MRIDRINLSVDTDDMGRIRSAGIFFENMNDLGDRISGTFGITAEQYAHVQEGVITIKDIAMERISMLFEISEDEDAMLRVIKLRDEFETVKIELAEENNNFIESTKTEVEEATKTIKTELEESLKEAKKEIEETVKTVAIEETEKVRKQLRNLVKIVDIPTDRLNDLIEIYDEWEESENVEVGEIRHYEGKLYEVIQAHTTQADWTPNATPALWKEIAPETTEDGEEIIPEFVQPTGAHDTYAKGDKVIFKDNVYESLIDNNAHSPEAYAAGWRIVE